MSSDQDKRARDAAIDDNLRLLYNPVAEEEVPERFRQLIDQLRSAKTTDDSTGSDGGQR